MKTIIRVEHKESGFGMFRHLNVETGWCANEVVPDLMDRHCNFLGMFEDFQYVYDISKGYVSLEERYAIMKNYHCAYKTLEQFNQWVASDEIRILIDNGFNVLMITVTDFIEGRDQIFYRKVDAVETKIINDLF
jgi:hypothetical protein